MTKGLFFEDLQQGQKLTTKGRTITEADIVNFAGISGDYNPIHTNAEFAAGTPFGQRIAHGALGFSIATGLSYQAGYLEETVMAFLSLEWKYSAPIYIGDTISCEMTIAELKLMRRLGGGKVGLEVQVLNQDGAAVQRGTWTLLVRSRAAEEAAAASDQAASA
jgi:3-hydroxybutyryl-CoA dehydratase